MDQRTANTLRAADEAVKRLVEACHKQGPLYAQSPKAVAQVSRTGKWLLNAIANLQHVLEETSNGEQAG